MRKPCDAPFGIGAPPYPGHGDRHIITTNLPTWTHVLKFIDRDPEIWKGFTNMYPRVMMQRDVLELNKVTAEKAGAAGQSCLIFPNPDSARECVDFATSSRRGDGRLPPDQLTIRVFDIQQRFWAVFFPLEKMPNVIMFWIIPGIGVSTRLAEETLKHIDNLREIPIEEASTVDRSPVEEDSVQEQLRRQILEHVCRAPLDLARKQPDSSDVYLFQTGMSAIYSLHKYLTGEINQRTVLFSFPFHETYHLFEEFGAGFQFYGLADKNDLADLTSWLETHYAGDNTIQALWCEVPSNPSCITPDLAALRRLADQYSFFLIVDDTIGSFCNVDFSSVADVLLTSLTKSFSGYADVMGGSIVLNPSLSSYPKLKSLFAKHHRNDLASIDAEVLLSNSADYLERSTILNRTSAAVANYFSSLATDPTSCVTKVYYPTTVPSRPLYEAYLRPSTSSFTPGYGCLLSIEFDKIEQTAAFYDALDLFKSPHLGAHVTLALPYVKALYSKQMDFAAKYDLRETQIRIAPGLEEEKALIEVFRRAVEAANGVGKKAGEKTGVLEQADVVVSIT